MSEAQRGGTYDVAVVGSGLAGSCLAAILARHGHRTLLLEAGSHPRFAVGESVTPEFGARAALLAATYDVPELGWMKNFQLLRSRISANVGVKRNFTFLHHRDGVPHRSRETSQFETMTYPLGPDSHIYRADLDAWLTKVAAQYGAEVRERTSVQDVDVRDDGVTLDCGTERFEARFVVDGSGHRSVLASKLDLRAELDLATDTRSLFTHMEGVGSITAARPSGDRLSVPSPPDEGTLHHLFRGGWFWVIPFDNHKAAQNPLCSVGLTLDRGVYPDNALPAEEEFRAFVARFPTVAEQLRSARPARDWIKTGRIQYRSKRLAGDRWCLLPHAAHFVDPLFSSGMPLTLMGVHEVAGILLESLRTDTFSAARFATLEETSETNVRMQDRLVHGALQTFHSPALFNAWFRIWALGNYHAALGLYRLVLNHEATGDRAFLAEASTPLHRRLLGMGLSSLQSALDEGYALLRELADGTASESPTVDGLFRVLAGLDIAPPQLHLTERDRCHLSSFTLFPLIGMIVWGKRHAPPEVRERYYDIGWIYFAELMRSFGRDSRLGAGALWRGFANVHWASSRA